MPEESGSDQLKGSISEEQELKGSYSEALSKVEESAISNPASQVNLSSSKTTTTTGEEVVETSVKTFAPVAGGMSIGERHPVPRQPQVKGEPASEAAESANMAGIAASQLGQATSNITVAPEVGNCCAGCQEPIRDKFIFSVIDLHWHQDCVQCSECASKLDERCYTFEGKLYCKLDYWRRFGPKCFACRGSIERSELVQRIKGNRVYHLKCFTCTDCRKQLKAGEMFHLLEGSRLLCKDDYSLQCVSLSGGKSSLSDATGASMQSGGGQDKGNGPFGGPFEHQQIFYTLTSSTGTSKQQPSQTRSKLSSSSLSEQVAHTGGLSGGEEEPVEEEEEEEEEEEDDGLEEEEDGGGGGGGVESDGGESLDDMRRLFRGYHHHHHHHQNQHHAHLGHLENDENHGYHSEQQQQVEGKRRSRLQASASAASNAKRKRRRKRTGSSLATAASASASHKKLANNRNGESILHGLAAHSNSSGSILAQQCPTASASLHQITSSTSNQQHLEPHSHPQQQQQQQPKSSFSSSASTASNSSTNSNSSLHNNSTQAGAAHLASGGQHHSGPVQGAQQQQQHQSSGGSGGGHKPTRVRTVLNERQLQTLRDVYASNPRPDALLKEQLVDMTGLSPRVIRVWFQNKRCKDKKKSILYKQMQQHEKDGRHLAGLSMARGVPLVAASPIQYDDQSSLSSTPAQQQQQPPLASDHSPQTQTGSQQQQQAIADIQAYQPPWKSLVEYAHQQQTGAPASNGSTEPSNRLNASSPHYQQLMGKIHGYMDPEPQTGAAVDSAQQQQHLQRHHRLPEQTLQPAAAATQPQVNNSYQQQQQPIEQLHQQNHLSMHLNPHNQHHQSHMHQPPPLMNHLHQF